MKRTVYISSIILLSLLHFGCDSNTEKDNGKPVVVCTTNILADAARQLVGDHATVLSIMGPGVDPHLYKASQGDLQKLRNASLIFYNGLYLEGKMAEVLKKLGRTTNVIAVAEALPKNKLIQTDAFGGSYDPHIWFDVALWLEANRIMTDALIALLPQHKGEIIVNLQKQEDSYGALEEYIFKQIATVDKSKRILVTAHDAFSYFGRAYDLEVRGLQGISTLSEYGVQDISELVNFIVQKEIKAIFLESSVGERSIKSVIEGAKRQGSSVIIGGKLFSDALGAPNSPEGTYTGMIKYNVNTIVEAIR